MVQKVAIDVQRGNAASVMATMPSSQDWAELQITSYLIELVYYHCTRCFQLSKRLLYKCCMFINPVVNIDKSFYKLHMTRKLVICLKLCL